MACANEIHTGKVGKVGEVSSNGVMEEGLKGTHASSRIVMYLAVVESQVQRIHSPPPAVDPQPPALPNKEGNGH